jgi:hypothetical protein
MNPNVVLHRGLITYPNFVLTASSTLQTLWDTKSYIFSDITPCSPLKVDQRFGVICRLNLRGRTETSVDFQRTTRRYIPEVRTLHNHRCENLKSYFVGYIHPFYFSFLCKHAKGSFSPRKDICLYLYLVRE